MRRTDLQHLTELPADFPLPLDQPFTTTTARREAGLSPRQLAWLVDQGFLRRLVRGVYVANQVPDSLELRCAALRLVVPRDAVVCDRHAGWLHGADMVLEPNEHVHLAPVCVFLPTPGRRLRIGLAASGERSFVRGDVIELNGLRVTSPLRTTWDLGRQRYVEASLAAMDQMLRLGLFSPAELAAGVPRFKGMRWVTTLRTMVAYVDGRAESPPESILRLRWIEAHLPPPIPQLEVYDVEGTFLARLDLGATDLPFAAEYDGDEWHSSPDQLRHDRERRALVEAETGFSIAVVRKENLFGPRADVEAVLRRGVAEARRRCGLPR
ncbi:type IV toxin-antitoxin system AbiEi family antitoxin domain-containing protein [Nocardioides nitrophenolicus]|uniref:type IV toxin-antitoxin system AbiEi family antitoxin domain-containing protein n=1 Tax=Nocardioides nitrophenolicus TaxID=60489 RepID=UPI001959060B|nr:type IV toxin-antitoxin system AbiEi family antitoxin domain-containing protein [Nocardioides nitrophenolicus]MBM7519615.1 hypothetical protein [Nocardioides nitrophenolicus]